MHTVKLRAMSAFIQNYFARRKKLTKGRPLLELRAIMTVRGGGGAGGHYQEARNLLR